MAKIKERVRCAKVKKNGKQCKNNRIDGSKYCESHGAFNPRSKRSRRKWANSIKTGKTSKILKAGQTVSRLVEEMKRNKHYLDIDENIAIMTTIMKKSLERAERRNGLDGVLDESKNFFIMLEKINRSLLTKAKIEEGLKHKIDIETIDVAMKQMIHIVKDHISNPLVMRSIADDFANIRVHDMPMKGHKPRSEHLKKLEEVNMETRELMGKIVAERGITKRRRKIILGLDE